MKIVNRYRWFVISAYGEHSVPEPIKDRLDCHRFLSGFFTDEKEAEDALLIYIADDIYMGLEFILVKTYHVASE